jgi:NADH-quinone oxidoreductase subunit F
VWAAYKMAHFFKHESCGKCTPCREGTYWLLSLMERIVHGEGTMKDIQTLESVATQMGGKSLCALGDFAINPVLSTLKHFRPEYEAYVNKGAGQKASAPAAKKPVPAGA